MFSETDLSPQNAVRNAVRQIVSFIDKPVFALLGIVYQLFFSIAMADIFSSGVISKFYQRVQLIIGVFVLFQLAMTILRGIVNPDSFTDSKSGAGNVIMRICTALIMLSLIVPINIPSARNEFEKQINNNGLLFGTLYSLQYRILNNNTIGKVVMGVADNDSNSDFLSGEDNSALKTSSNIFVSTILKGFYRINLIPEGDRKTPQGKEDDQVNDNRVCRDIDQSIINEYKKIDADPGKIIDNINETCSIDSELEQKYNIKTGILGTKLYAFTFMPVVSTVIALIFVVILISFCVDIAIRAIKLAVLRLIAPIPIINYMDPKGGKDGAFNAWVKALTTTYLDLFIRIASVYFVIYMIQQMLAHGITTSSTGVLKFFTVLFIWIGLFYFAKEAPKFIKQVLGMKDEGGGIFSGIGKIAGLGAAAGGIIGSGLASARASRMADDTREAFNQKDIFGRTVDPNSRFNRAKHLVAGIAGGISGGVAGGAAAINAKDHRMRNAMEAMQKRNAAAIAKGNDGSTLFGRLGSSVKQYTTGDTKASSLERQIGTNKSRIDALKAVKSRVSGEMIKSDWTGGDLGIAADNAGNRIGKVNFKHYEAQLAEARARGDGKMTFRDLAGATHEISLADAERQRGFLLKNNEDDFVVQHVNGTAAKVDDRLMTLIHDANITKTVDVNMARNADGSLNDTAFEGKNLVDITNRDSINKAIEAFEDYNSELNRRNAINKANDRYSSKK